MCGSPANAVESMCIVLFFDRRRPRAMEYRPGWSNYFLSVILVRAQTNRENMSQRQPFETRVGAGAGAGAGARCVLHLKITGVILANGRFSTLCITVSI